VNDTLDKKAAQLWEQLEAAGKQWQKRLGTGSMVIPLYELRRHWNGLAALYRDTEHPLEKQAREFEIARLRAEVDWLRKSLAHAVAHGPTRVTELSSARMKKSN